MKKKQIFRIACILCIVLAAALLLSVIGLISANAKVAALEEEVQTLNAHVQALEMQLSVQDFLTDQGADVDYATLSIESWDVDGENLTVSGYAFVGLFSDSIIGAQLELRRGEILLQSIPLMLELGEAENVYEAAIADTSFRIPELNSEEELQLWLVVTPTSSAPLSAYGAGWYVEDGSLMLIAG